MTYPNPLNPSTVPKVKLGMIVLGKELQKPDFVFVKS